MLCRHMSGLLGESIKINSFTMYEDQIAQLYN